MDKQTNGKVSGEEFVDGLSRIKLGLPQAKITQLLNLFDVRRERIVYREDFLGLLNAYHVNTEKYELAPG
jgi:Ca2+-binding EF-hand superfamily protein